jgi:hypothetical protein
LPDPVPIAADNTPRAPDDEYRLEPNIAEEIFRELATIVASR